MNNLEARREALAKPTEIFHGSPDHPETCIWRYTESGVHERRTVIDIGKGGNPVEIVQITDVHFNYCNEEDLADEELAYTKTCRKWLHDAASVTGIRNAISYAKLFDCVVVTGDTLDYQTRGAMELTKREIWDVVPDALITLGGHDVTREMQTGKPNELSVEERLCWLAREWKHDIFYESRVIGDKALVVALDNGCSCYRPSQVKKLKADIARARAENLALLIFEHEPIATRGPAEDDAIPAFHIYDSKVRTFLRELIGGSDRDESDATKEVYRLITENADVVRGVFCGHRHSAFYTEIHGTYTDENGAVHERIIPQPVLEGNPYDGQCGHVMRITVK